MTTCKWEIVVEDREMSTIKTVYLFLDPWFSEEEAKREVERQYGLIWTVLSASPH